MTSYDIAIVGTGSAAGIHAAEIGRMGGRGQVVAAVDPDHGRLLGFAERWAVPRLYRSLESLLEHEEPDVIVLCTPSRLHAEQAVACLKDGRTVLCEKPPARSLAELDAIAEAAAGGTGSFASVFQHRFGSAARRLRRLVGDERLGPAMAAVSHSLWFRPEGPIAPPARGIWHDDGGGPTLAHGIPHMDLLLSILGPWREVVAVAARRAGRTETEDLSCAIVTFANGAVATVISSLISPRPASYLRFDFANATVEISHPPGRDDESAVTAAPGHEEVLAEAWSNAGRAETNRYAAQLTAVLDAIESGQPPPVGLAESRAALELVTAVYAAAFTGRPVRPTDIGPDSPFYHRLDGTGAPWPPPAADGSSSVQRPPSAQPAAGSPC